MQSFIKNSNSYKIPFGLILLFVFIYSCPNIRFLSVGENSFSPIFIFLFGYSFFAYFLNVDNFKLSLKGINKSDHFIIRLFSLQITLIFFPAKTSSPYVCFSTLIISAIKHYEKNHYFVAKES